MESEYLTQFVQAANIVFANKEIIVKKGENLFYELAVNKEMKLAIRDINQPSRGSSAFQTDICISERKNGIIIPRIVIEFKTNPSTHDIPIYSSKAGKHKKIYPWLRYGLLADAIENVPNRFFKHNEHLDFFIAAKKHRVESNIQMFVKNLIEYELNASKLLEGIYFDEQKHDFYRRKIEFDDFNIIIN